ncbi:MAG: DPP IV N-terminal domain-containing protein [Xanthomonadales bacterium]|nr:DPP IV N-terminal domain-containing protein [Xanthomonadales bacterium]
MRLVIATLLAAATINAMAEPLTIERIFDGGSLDGPAPRSLEISPDGARLSLLRPKATDQNRYDLWAYDVAAKQLRLLVDADAVAPKETISAEEAARRERARTAGFSGIVDYAWSPDGRKLLFPLGDALYLYDLAATKDQALRALDTAGAVLDPRISPKGGYVSWLRDGNLWVLELATGKSRALTRDGGGSVRNGEAEFIAQEEMGRDRGYWWAPDDSLIAFERTDDKAVPVVRRFEIQADRTDVIEQRYPAAGDANVEVRLGLVAPGGGEARWIDLGADKDIYLARVDWLPDAKRVAYQWQSRDQKRLELRFVDVATLEQRTVLAETSATWIDLHDDLHFLADGKGFVWASDRTGYHHLYHYGLDGKLVATLSAGDWNIDRLLAVDEKAGHVYVESNRDFAGDRQLYRLALDGSTANDPERISQGEGVHQIAFSPDARFYVDTYSSPRVPPQVSLHAADGTRIDWIEKNAFDAAHPFAPYRDEAPLPEFGTLAASDGQPLHYRLFKPRGFDPAKRYPVFDFYYGGPGVQRVVRAWGDPATVHASQQVRFCQYMAEQGYVVFTLDNRGMARRGRAFSDAIHGQLGAVEVEDQLAGIAWLKQQPWVDGSRIGVFGWSYGGYLTTMLLAKASPEIALGVAVAPVTDWMLYDTHYTERYLGLPSTNRAGYIRSAPFAWLDGLSSPLLLVHGMADDNVQFTNSTKLMAELQERGVAFELMTYPGGKHGLSTPAMRKHVYHAIAAAFARHLRTPAP